MLPSASAVHLGSCWTQIELSQSAEREISLASALAPHRAHSQGDGVGKAALLRVKDEGAGFQPGHLDQRLHQKVQLVDLALHGAQKFRLLFRRELVLLQDVGEHLDVGDGGLDLVGDVAHQALDDLLVLLALALALAHDVEVLHQLSLHLAVRLSS